MAKVKNSSPEKGARSVKKAVRSYISSIGSEQSGYILFMVLFVLLIVCLVGIALIVVGTSEVNLALRSKMMEQAYSAAEAGVNRAVVYVASDISINGTTQGHYPDPPGSTQTFQKNFKEDLPGDTHSRYDTSVYYDTRNPTEVVNHGYGDSFYKLVISTGTYTLGEKSVERTIEAKVYIPGSTAEVYDEAFDYCIFNYFNKLGDESGNWPSDDSNNPVPFNTGKFIFDGSTPYGDRTPLGAIYTRGNIKLEFDSSEGRAGRYDRLIVLGNVVATNDLTIQSAATRYTDIDFGNPDNRNSNLVAGIDGTGNATITSGGGLDANLKIMGAICAGQNLTISGTAIHYFKLLGGLSAGGNVFIKRDDVGNQLHVGPIVSCGSTVLNCINSGITEIESITAGSDPQVTSLPLDEGSGPSLQSSNLGVGLACGRHELIVGPIISSGEVAGTTVHREYSQHDLKLGDIKAGYGHNMSVTYPEGYDHEPVDPSLNYGVWLWFLNGANIGNIQSSGRVNIEALGNRDFSLKGGITAGTDGGTPPVGVSWRVDGTGAKGGNEGPVVSAGGITADARVKSDIGMDELLSGGSINLTTMPELGIIRLGNINVTKFEATGDITVKTSKQLDYAPRAASPGTISAKGNVTILGDDTIHTKTIKADGAVSLTSLMELDINGAILAGGNVTIECARGGTTGVGHVLGIWGQNVTVKRNAGLEAGLVVGAIPGYGTDSIRATGQVTLDAYPGKTIKMLNTGLGVVKTGSPPILTPGGIDTARWWNWPTQPTAWSPATLPAPVSVPATSVPAVPPAPAFGHGTNPIDMEPYEVDALAKAGLDKPLRLPQPNWWHFMQDATNDDKFPNTPPHILTDDDGDGVIEFLWESGPTGYSTSETVYQDDPSVEVRINVGDWTSNNPRRDEVNFTGTLVSKGPVTINADNARWRGGNAQNIMNVISGSDITFDTTAALNNVKTLHFHWYAHDNIVFKRGEIRGATKLYGSLTAGNEVIFNTERLFENCTFSWSRWDIEPAAWLPDFKVLSWKEI